MAGMQMGARIAGPAGMQMGARIAGPSVRPQWLALALALAGTISAWGHQSLGQPAAERAQRQASPPAPLVRAIRPLATAPAPLNGVAQLPYVKYVLGNGLEILLHEDHRLPRVAVNMWYHVGPARETPGRSGFAHLFEHLMFGASRHVGTRADHLLEAAGATNANGTTSWDRTNYFQTIPREYLELALWIESDRMGFLSLTQEGLSVQQDVVKNERRQSYENTPYGPSELALFQHLFPKSHPYHGAVIGSEKDISDATLADAREFHETHYGPSNATLAIAGDIDIEATRRSVDRYFGNLPARDRVVKAPAIAPGTPRTMPVHAPVSLDRSERLVIREPVQLPKITFAWLAPPAFGPDHAALEVALNVLAGGKSTRLYRKLVVQDRVASEVSAYQDAAELASMLLVSATGVHGKPSSELEQALNSVLSELGTQGPTAVELERAKKGLRVALEADLQELNGPGGDSGRAGLLQKFNHYLGDPGYLPRWMEQLERTNISDVRRVVAQYLSANYRLVVVTEPADADHTANSSANAPPTRVGKAKL